jgi:raffinose/stachyose/melibiose transport system permease protein
MTRLGPVAGTPRRALRPPGGSFARRTRVPIAPYLFLALPLLVYGTFSLWPTFQLVLLSLNDWDGLSPKKFIGIGNFVELLGDGVFWEALLHNLLWMVGAALVPVGLGLGLASFLARSPTFGRTALRTAYFLPQVLATVAVAVIWGWIYDPTFGAINTVLTRLGLGGLAMPWLGDETLALPALFLTWTWIQYGFSMVVLLAGLSAIDEVYYDAAKVDGAGGWLQFRHVTLPFLSGPLATVVLVTAIGAFQLFDLVFVMTRGGPGTSTQVLDLYMLENAIRYNRVGYGAAVAVALSLLVWIFSIFYLRARGTFRTAS